MISTIDLPKIKNNRYITGRVVLKMDIAAKNVSDLQVLQLFSEHDDFMIDFLGKDKV